MFTIDLPEHKEAQLNTVAKAKETIIQRLKTLNDASLDTSKIVSWLDEVFNNSIRLSQGESFEPKAPEPITIPKEISAFAVQTIIRILSMPVPKSYSIKFMI